MDRTSPTTPGVTDAATQLEGRLLGDDAPIPAQLGPFQLLEPLGRGGMGVVFRARQHLPVDREVALKLLPGALDPTTLACFEVERHTLARMQHPAIAQLHEAGTTADGRPWFAMELVRGQTLDAYCAAQSLSRVARLRLLIRVCRAVQYAHDRGIVHRDLKPANVLVQTVDGEAMPKLIDFGIASGLATRARAAGTEAYMSPEQLRDGERVDTRNDVYAIGVMACELLAGLPAARVSAAVRDLPALAGVGHTLEPPHGREADRTPALQQAVRDRLAAIAAESGSEWSAELGHLLARSVAPRRQARYDSAGALADDLQRYLDGAPIEAHPPSSRYLVGKFIARHRLAFAAAAAVLFGLVLALAIALNALGEARVQRDLARVAEAEAARQARIAGSVNRFLIDDLLGAANLDERPNADRLTLIEVVETAASGLRSDARLEPEAEADIRVALGRALASLGRFQSATEAFERAAQLRQQALGPAHPATLAAEADAAAMLIDLSRHDAARQRLGELLARAAPLAAREPQLLDATRLKLVRNAIFAGDYAEAETALDAVLSRTADPRQRVEARRLQGWLLSRMGRHAEAVTALQTLSDDARTEFGAESWPSLMADGAVATALHRAGRFAEAADLRAQILVTMRERFAGHSELGVQLSHLAAHLVQLRRADAAEAAAREAIERMSRQLGPGHRMLGNAHSHLGAALLQQQRHEEAGRMLLEARRIFAAALPADHPLVAQNEARIAEWGAAAAR